MKTAGSEGGPTRDAGVSGSSGRASAPTVRDVAALAGVSPRTVSNVVTGGAAVRAETRRRVETAIEELGYRPNLAARRLRTGRSQTIGLVVPDVTVPYFRDLADAILASAADAGLAVVVEQTGGDLEREREVLAGRRPRHVDGVVLVAVEAGPEDLERLPTLRPVVLAGTSARSDLLDAIAPDARAAGREVGERFVATGRTHPAVILPGDTRWPPERDERHLGFVDALAAAGIPLPATSAVAADEVTPAAGMAALRRLVASHGETDAVFALGDALALGALRALHELGRAVPADVALAGYGNVAAAAVSVPSLTTVDPGRDAIAQGAVALLVERIGSVAPPRQRVVAHRLVERESTGGRG